MFPLSDVVDVFLQRHRDGTAAKRFFKWLLRTSASEPRRIVTDKLRSYGVAHRDLIPDTTHDTSQYANNRAELSHQPTRVRERGMRRFKSTHQTQRFLNTHAAVYNLFNLGRHLISAKHYRAFRARSLPLGYNVPLRLGIVRRPHKSCAHKESRADKLICQYQKKGPVITGP